MRVLSTQSREWRQREKNILRRSSRLILDRIADEDVVGASKAFNAAVCRLNPANALNLSKMIASAVRDGREIADYLSRKQGKTFIHIGEEILPPGKCAFFVARHRLALPDGSGDGQALEVIEKCQYDSIAGPISRIISSEIGGKSIPAYFGRLKKNNQIYCELFEFIPGMKRRLQEYSQDNLCTVLSLISDMIVHTPSIQRAAKKRGLRDRLIVNRRSIKKINKCIDSIQLFFGHTYPDECQWFAEYRKIEGLIIKKYNGIPRAITHNDLHHHNIILRDGHNPYVIDWDSVSLSPAGTDLRILFSLNDIAQAEALNFIREKISASGNQRALSRYSLDDMIFASTLSQFYVYVSAAQRNRNVHQLRAAIRVGNKLLRLHPP